MHRLHLCKEYQRISKVIAFFLLTVLYLTMTAPWALAHKVLLAAYVEGDTIFVEGGFSDGTPCKNARIEVFDPSGNIRTDIKKSVNRQMKDAKWIHRKHLLF